MCVYNIFTLLKTIVTDLLTKLRSIDLLLVTVILLNFIIIIIIICFKT